ncbi:MAG: hypothetical protein WKF41_16365 [Gaiellaceae bacterium]
MPTIIYGDGEPFESPSVLVEPEAVGWEAKPQGLCRGELCVPFPLEDGRVDLAAFAERLGQPVAHEGDTWAFGEPRRPAGSLDAPDFTLPDLDGRLHSLADYRGNKVLLVSWASW